MVSGRAASSAARTSVSGAVIGVGVVKLATWARAWAPRSVRPEPWTAVRKSRTSVIACSSAAWIVGRSRLRCQP